MMFLYSLKLLGSNWVKALKFFLFYVVIWGICFALLLPSFFEFKDLFVTNFSGFANSCSGLFGGGLGQGLHDAIGVGYSTIVDAFKQNVGLAVYGLLVIFLFMPFLINIGKYAFCEMLYSYMTSKNKLGFFSALVRGLRRSVTFSLCKTFYSIFFLGATFASVYGLGQITNTLFVVHFLPWVLFAVMVLLFSLHELTILGWMSASIVFNCNVFSAWRKGFKAVKRHFWATFGTTVLYFVLFWGLTLIFGIYCLAVLVPFVTIMLCVYNLVMFFFSQGMRFYYDENNILTPKKLEEVDKFNKACALL